MNPRGAPISAGPSPGRAGVAGVTAFVFLLLVVGGLLPGISNSFRSEGGAGAATFSPSASAPSSFPTPIRHVLVIMLENQERDDVLANGSYEAGLAANFSQAARFYSPMHYSLPNYLAATSGYTTNLFAPVSKTDIGSLATASNRSWKTYLEDMPSPCDLATNQTTPYTYWHNPFAMYRSMILHPAACRQHMVNFSAWDSDVAADTVPNYAFIVPNTTHDAHDQGLPGAEQWLSQWLPPLMADPFFARTALFLTYDEGTTNLSANGSVGGGHLYMAMVSPYARAGFASLRNYTTFSLLTTSEWLLGLGRTGTNDNWTLEPPMTDLFDFPVRVTGTVLDGHGRAIASARVSDRVDPAVSTNASGGFTLWIRMGNFTLHAHAPGGLHGSRAISVSGAPLSGIVIRVHR